MTTYDSSSWGLGLHFMHHIQVAVNEIWDLQIWNCIVPGYWLETWSKNQLTQPRRKWHLAKIGWVPIFFSKLPQWIECREPVKLGKVAKFVYFEVEFKGLEVPQYSSHCQMHLLEQSVHFWQDVFANLIPTHFETTSIIFYLFLVIPNDSKQF